MDAVTFSALVLSCAPLVHPTTAHALVAVESGFNPYAIGVVGAVLERQPRSAAQAAATASMLEAGGWDYSVGLAQINRRNFTRLGLSVATALDPCQNLQAMQTVLLECGARAPDAVAPQTALRQTLSCYYSGNFVTGFRHGYVQRVASAVHRASPSSPVRPSVPQ